MSDFNLGTVTAYGYAKDKGYTGTEDEYAELMASYADVAEQAAESAEQAAASATTATAKASEAAQSATAAASSKTAAETAQGGAETAAQTATTKAGEATTAATTATNKATEATTAATTATGKATEAAGSATTATTKAGEASTSATNAAASATRAQEILDSIPEDYSQMSEDVSNLKDGLTAVESDVTDLKEEISNIGSDFNLLTYDKSSNSYNHLGLDIHNFHIKGTITQGDKNICVTGDGVTDPTEISFSTLNEKYFSVPLVADKKYTFALLGNWESNGTPPNGVHVADKGTRTAKTITIPGESWGNGIATLSYTPTKTDVYAVKVYFPTAGTVDLQLALYPPNNVYQQISNITALTLSN